MMKRMIAGAVLAVGLAASVPAAPPIDGRFPAVLGVRFLNGRQTDFHLVR